MIKIFPDINDFRKFFEMYYPDDTTIVATSGGFDPVHIGHLRCIQETVDIAKSHRGITVIIVNGDGFLVRKKGKPFMNHKERMEIISGIEGVDYVVGWDDGSQTVTGCLEILKPDIFTKGGDRSDPTKVPEFPMCQKIGCEIKFGVGGKKKVQSSSELIAGVSPKLDGAPDLDEVDLMFKTKQEFNDIRGARTIDKPWGYEELLTHTDRYAAKILTIMPGHRLSKQYHEIKDETVYVLSGTLSLEIADDEDDEDSNVIFLQVGECYRIPAGTIHRFSSWMGTVKLFEVSTPELDDVIRIKDDYNRT